MDIGLTVYAPERGLWRAWLAEHYRHAPEVWLVFHVKAAGVPNVSYNDAVEEALCFGWIDSLRKRLDANRLAQRFSPRRPKVAYSQPNKERLRRMISAGQVTVEVRLSVEDLLAEPFVFPPDILARLQADPVTWAHFNQFSEAYRRIRVAFVDDGRKRPGEFEKRLDHLLEKTRRGKPFGHGIESYY
ncbi:MAG: YdeI/OmpD-associated family protein [Rhodothermales bacterium]|nr:YdeI/OmpD-associated family protein [Rhodothermales bacterium]